MTTQTKQDNAIKKTIDLLAEKYSYPAGVLDTDKGTLTYDVSTPVFGFTEALNRVNFRIDISNLTRLPVTAHYKAVMIKLPDWGDAK